MENLNNLNKALKTVEQLAKQSNMVAENAIAQLESDEDKAKYRDLLTKAKTGNLTIVQLMNELKNGN